MEAPQGAQPISARVNFGARRASVPQLLLALLIWGGTIALAVGTVWSYLARNVILKTGIGCAVCKPGFHPVGNADCPWICVSEGFQEQISKQCVDAPIAAALAAKGEEDLPPDLQSTMRYRRLKADVFVRLTAAETAPEHTTVFQLLVSPVVLPLFLPIILVTALVWYVALHRAAKACIYGTLALFLLGMAYGYYLTENWAILIIMGIVLLVTFRQKQDLDQGAKCLEAALSAVGESPHSLLVIMMTAALQLIYIGMLVAMMVFCSQVWTVHEDPETQKCKLTPFSMRLNGISTVVAMLTVNFFNMVAGYSVAFAVGCWYFHPSEPEAPPVPMMTGMKMAMASQNGTGVCAQAASVMTLVDYMESKRKQQGNPCMDPLTCFALCVYSCFRAVLESLCVFALVAVALDGGPLLETSRRACDTLGSARVARFAVIDSSLTWLLRVQAQALSTVVGIMAWATIDESMELGYFKALLSHATSAESESETFGQWIVVGTIFVFYELAKRPLTSLVGIILYEVFIAGAVSWVTVNAIMAALLVGSIASLVLHLFAEVAAMAMASMLYCWSLEEATCGPQGLPTGRRCRRTVAALWEDSGAMAPSAPPVEVVAVDQQAREVQLAPSGAGAV